MHTESKVTTQKTTSSAVWYSYDKHLLRIPFLSWCELLRYGHFHRQLELWYTIKACSDLKQLSASARKGTLYSSSGVLKDVLSLWVLHFRIYVCMYACTLDWRILSAVSMPMPYTSSCSRAKIYTEGQTNHRSSSFSVFLPSHKVQKKDSKAKRMEGGKWGMCRDKTFQKLQNYCIR